MNPLNFIKFVPLPALRALALFVARIIAFTQNTKTKTIVETNLKLAYPELNSEKRKQLANLAIRNEALTAVESVKCWAMSPKWSLNKIENVYNKEVFEEAVNNPKGMLAIVPHLGTWEIMNAWLNQYGSPTILYKPASRELINDFILDGREKLSAKLVPTDASGVKAIFKTLKSGGFSIILPDHVPKPSGGVVVPFFNIKTLTSTLAPKLASKTKCSLVGLVCIRNDNNRFDIHCFKLDDPNLYDKDLEISTTAMNVAIENMINLFPEHYMWSYKRFKKVPLIKNPYKVTDQELDDFIKDEIHHNP